MNDKDSLDDLFALMHVARTQQEAINNALVGLQAERAAVARERSVLIEVSNMLRASAGDMVNMAAGAIPAIRKTAEEAVGETVVDASRMTVHAIGEASSPFLKQLSDAARAVEELEGQLSGAVESLGLKLAVVAGVSAAAGGAIVLMVAWLAGQIVIGGY